MNIVCLDLRRDRLDVRMVSGSDGNSSGLSETSDEVACVMFVRVEPLCQLG